MKINRLYLFLFFSFVFSESFAAYRYDLRCQNNKMVWLGNEEKPPPSSECQVFLKNGFSKCYDSYKAPKNNKQITISTPNDQYYESKESDGYDRKAIQDIITAAVRSGNDPYLALSLVIIENPPLVHDTGDDFYSKFYGHIPVDKIGVADVFNCDSQIDSYNSKKSSRTYLNKGALREFNIDSRASQKIVCLAPGAATGSSPEFWFSTTPIDKLCCAKIRIDKESSLKMQSDYDKRLLSYLANEYIKRRFTSGIKRSRNLDSQSEKMAMIAQAYNGYGTFGASEKMDNKCLSGIDMGKKPVYGAGVSETMLNSVMNNSEIRKMVDQANRSVGVKPSSYLCEAYGDGDHKISGYAFTGLLKDYLSQRSNCRNHAYKLKNSPKNNQNNSSQQSSGAGSNSSKSKSVKTSN